MRLQYTCISSVNELEKFELPRCRHNNDRYDRFILELVCLPGGFVRVEFKFRLWFSSVFSEEIIGAVAVYLQSTTVSLNGDDIAPGGVVE